MWLLDDSWRYGAGCLAALALLTACDAGAGNSGAPSTSSAATTSAAVTTPTVAAPAVAQGPRIQKWIELQVGDCLSDPPPTDPSVVSVSIVDCAIPHSAEVYLRANVKVDAAVADVADQQCNAGFARYTGHSVGDGPLVVTYLIDSNQDRTSNDPLPSTVICLLQAANGGPLTVSARR
jgi:hypothetical protein